MCWTVFSASCQETPSTQTSTVPVSTQPQAHATLAVVQVTEAAAAPPDSVDEYLDWDAVKLNGKLPLVGKTEELHKLLGRPDSLVNPDFNDVCVFYFDNQRFQYAYFKETRAEVDGDTAIITSIDFRHNSKLELITPTLRLNSKTTLSSLAKIFPKAVKNKGEVDVHKVGKRIEVSLSMGKIVSNDSWLLLFDKGLLVEIQWFMPC